MSEFDLSNHQCWDGLSSESVGQSEAAVELNEVEKTTDFEYVSAEIGCDDVDEWLEVEADLVDFAEFADC